MHGVHVSIVSFVKQAGGITVGSVSGSATTPAEVERAGPRLPTRPRARPRPPRTRRAGRRAHLTRLGRRAGQHQHRGLRRHQARRSGRGVGRSGAAGRVLYGFVNHEMTTTYLARPPGSGSGTSNRPATSRAPVRPRISPTAPGSAAPPATSAMWTRWRPRRSWRSGWPGAKNRVDLEAGRYDTIMPPTAVSDLMIYAYWLAGARNAWDGQSVLSRHGAGTRIGEEADPARGDALLRPGVRRTAVRAVRPRLGVVQREAGLRQRSRARPDRLDPGTASGARCANPGHRRMTSSRSLPPSTTSSSKSTAAWGRSRRWSPAPTVGCC